MCSIRIFVTASLESREFHYLILKIKSVKFNYLTFVCYISNGKKKTRTFKAIL